MNVGFMETLLTDVEATSEPDAAFHVPSLFRTLK